MNCPKCSSSETYRKHPQELTIWCDRCGHSWTESQPLKPYLQREVWKSKGLKGKYYITVWRCPQNSSRYSFAYCYGASLPVQFNEFSECDWLSGSYATPHEALEAGIREVLS